MIISCDNCNKKFEINSDLIPEKGRMLQCGSCAHNWFFKSNALTAKVNVIETNDNIKNAPLSNKIITKIEAKKSLEIEKISIPKDTERFIIEAESVLIDKKKNTLSNKIPRFIFVLIISFIAFIVLMDTFKSPISKIIPNIEFMLYNLYEIFKDIELFLKDLI